MPFFSYPSPSLAKGKDIGRQGPIEMKVIIMPGEYIAANREG